MAGTTEQVEEYREAAELPDKQQDEAYERLKRGIIEFEYLPGQRLSAKDVRETFGGGRTPVREAIVRLQQEGLVYRSAKSGSYVSLIDIDAAKSAHFLRLNIERPVVREAAARCTEESLSGMRATIEAQKAAVRSHDQRAFFDADNDMHEAIYTIAGRTYEWAWLARGAVDLDRFRWLHVKARGLGWQSILDEHEQLLGALEHHDPEEAAYLVEHHLHVMLDEKEEVLSAFPGYFKNAEDQTA